MKTAQVGIVMGSDSDLATMSAAAKVLQEFGIESEIRVLSAHRTPEQVVAWVRASEQGGTKVFIAGAGVSAALPGVVAAHTARPVIGVPLSSRNSAAGGLDAILSIAQMPPGVPVACVSLDGAKNAGILAAQIIGAGDAGMGDKIVAYKQTMASEIVAKDEKLQRAGVKKYLEEKSL
jgi:5-(carboxyamino)imidazole ribonucleotide mutase